MKNVTLFSIHLKIKRLNVPELPETQKGNNCKCPEKRKISASSLSEQEIDKMSAIWDETTPDGLQRKFFFKNLTTTATQQAE
jgi:hypothetical protein